MNKLLWGLAATAIAATAVAGPAHAAPRAVCAQAAVFQTEVQTGGETGTWTADAELQVVVRNRQAVVDRTATPGGTTLTWTGPNGNAAITFQAAGTFTGTVQFPNDGNTVGYRGVLQRWSQTSCDQAATVKTQIQGAAGTTATTTGSITPWRTNPWGGGTRWRPNPWGGTPTRSPWGPATTTSPWNTPATPSPWGTTAADSWRADADLIALVKNRHIIIDKYNTPAGTALKWTGPYGNADIAFTATNVFTGTAQFPNGGSVGYRSAL